MTWTSHHRRGEILRSVIGAADQRRDGVLPTDVEGVAETFEDDLALLGALQLRWHTRLAGRIDRALMAQPRDLEQAVADAWRSTAEELPGIRAIIDRYRTEPSDPEVAAAMAKAAAKERTLLAMSAGRVSGPGQDAVRVGSQIEARARAAYADSGRFVIRSRIEGAHRAPGLLARLRQVLAA